MKKSNQLKLFLSLFLDQNSTKRFLVGVILGFGFSIAVILSTIGIMDGFERSLRIGLKKSSGDLTLLSRNGFFNLNQNIKDALLKNNINNFSKTVQTESFLIFNETPKGVLVKGIDGQYGELVNLELKLNENEAAIGIELANSLNIKINDEIVLAFAKGNSEYKALPGLNRFKVTKIINHGVYQKDSRLVYLNLKQVQQILELSEKINAIAFNVYSPSNTDEKIKSLIVSMRDDLGNDFYLRPYWRDFTSLIEAVKVEKTMIALILQLVVIISIFNVLAFIIFINEKKAKELFLFKALGLSQKIISKLWLQVIFIIWLISCIVSIGFVWLFSLFLKYLSSVILPADIYYMPRLELYINLNDYLMVFAIAFVWILGITYFLLRRIKKKSLLEGLRVEFA